MNREPSVEKLETLLSNVLCALQASVPVEQWGPTLTATVRDAYRYLSLENLEQKP
jgi:hypothetical protein